MAKLEKITDRLEREIPPGCWCRDQRLEIEPKKKICPYLQIIDDKDFCQLLEEYVWQKECGVNEGSR